MNISKAEVNARGCGLLSRLTTYIPTRLLGVVFISVGYLEPGLVWDIGDLYQLISIMVHI